MTGWRIGYTAGDKTIIKAMSKLQGQSTSCPTSISQAAAIEALTGNQSNVLKMKLEFKKRRDFIVKKLNQIDGVTCEKPGGAFYVFPNFNKYIGKNKTFKTSNDLSMYFLEKKHLVSVSGDAFGAPGHIRFSYAASIKDLKNAIKIIEKSIQELK